MTCENSIGIKNILLTFTDCDTGVVVGPYSHLLSSDELPTVNSSTVTNESLTGGYVRRTLKNAMMTINIIRDLRIPLNYYQGNASVDAQLEYVNGLVYTGKGGSVTGDEQSDTHAVTMNLSFKEVDELLPDGALVNA